MSRTVESLREGLLVYPGHLAVTDPSMIRALDRPAWSASSVNSFSGCPGRWAIERLLPDIPDPFGAAESGSAGHLVLEQLFALPGPERTLDRAAQIIETLHEPPSGEARGEVEPPQGPANLIRWRALVLSKIAGLWTLEDPRSVHVLGLERSLSGAVIDGIPVSGFMDRTSAILNSAGEVIGSQIEDYKGLDVLTPLLTPTGWTTMGAVGVGDQLFGVDGLPCTVTVKSDVHHRPCFRVEFDDGSHLVADNVHLWEVSRGSATHVVSTDTLFGWLKAGETLTVPRTAALQVGSYLHADPFAAVGEAIRDNRLDPRWLFSASYQRQAILETLIALNCPQPAAPLQATLGMAPRTVVSVVPVASVPTQCIQVDAPRNLYLAGDRLVPTHNTGKSSPPYKRAKFGDDKADQMLLYGLAVEQLDGRRPDELRLLFTSEAAPDAYSPVMTPKAVDQVRRKFTDSWQQMKASAQSGAYELRPSPLCGWCPLATVCPAADAAGRAEAKVPAANFGSQVGIPLAPLTVPVPNLFATSQTPAGVPALPRAQPAVAVSSSVPTEGATPMSSLFSAAELQPWIETDPSSGQLNPAAYAAIAAFNLVEMATEALFKAGHPLTKDSVPALATVFADVIAEAQSEVFGRTSMQVASHTTLRFALRSATATIPPPLGQSDDQWRAWKAKVVRRLISTATTAGQLYLSGPQDAAWGPLTDTPAASAA